MHVSNYIYTHTLYGITFFFVNYDIFGTNIFMELFY